MRFTVVHAADLHLDTPCATLGRTAPEVAEALRDASLAAFSALVDLTLERSAAVLLLAGDLYDGAERGIRAQRVLQAGLERLGAAGVRTFIVTGNHDPVGSRWRDGLPRGSHLFGPEAVEAVPVEVEGRVVATVHGISYAQQEERRNLARMFHRSGAGLQFGLLHANVGDNPSYGPYAACSLEDLRAGGMDYWALGHVHDHRVLLAGGPWAVYPGVLQGRNPSLGEIGPKGAMVLGCDDAFGLVEPPLFVALDRIRFENLAVDLTGARDLADATDRVAAAGAEAAGRADGRALVLRCVLEGDFAPEAELQTRIPEVVEELRREGLARDPFVWWDRVDVDTRPPLQREELRRAGDLAAELLAEGDRLRARPDELALLLGELEAELVRFPARDALERRRGPEEILAAAEDICLRLLVGGGAQ